MRSMDGEITRLAEKQHGVFTLAQAGQAGLRRAAIRHRVSSGRWERVSVQVFRVPGSPRTWEQRLMAATLAGGPRAVASHRSAAALLGVPGFDRRGSPEVTTPRAQRHRSVDGRVHRSRVLPEHHMTVVDGIPVTRLARTLVDLAGALHPGRTARAIDNCLSAGLVDLSSLQATFEELAERGRTGAAAMRQILGERQGEYVAPASELEARFIELVRSAGLPEPVRQFDAGDDNDWIGRIDFAYPDIGLLIELDSRRHHSALLDRTADARRDNRLVAGGWREVARFSWFDVVDRPVQTLARLRRLLAGAAA